MPWHLVFSSLESVVVLSVICKIATPGDNDQYDERDQNTGQKNEVQKPGHAERHLDVDVRTDLSGGL